MFVIQNVIAQFSESSSQLLHVEIYRVIILESTSNICAIFPKIKSVVQDHFITINMRANEDTETTLLETS